MIGTDDIEDIAKINVWTGAIEGEKPNSMVILASVGSGKSTILKKASEPSKVEQATIKSKGKEKKVIEVRKITGSTLYTTNTTPYMLYTRYGRLLRSGQIKHIIIPDFLNILNQPKQVAIAQITFYNSLIEEGIIAIESRDGSFLTEFPVSIGLLTAISEQDYRMGKNAVMDKWGAMGFLSRLMPVSFRYSDGVNQDIRDSTKHRAYLNEVEYWGIKLPDSQHVELPFDMATLIEEVTLRVRDSIDKTAARKLKQLQRFCMASALMNGRNKVDIDDVGKLYKYEKYFNWNCTATIGYKDELK